MKKTYLQRGFTLIELLVVIAIIGILSSVVLASLSTARNKANDTKVRAQLATVRAGAELFANANNGYAASVMGSAALPCTGGMFIDNASGLFAVTGTANAWPNGTLLSCQATATAWAVSANLSTTGEYWCVDSSGKSQSRASQLGSGVVVCS